MVNLSDFDLDPERGYLPNPDPLRSLPSDFSEWEEVASALPKLLMTDQLRRTIDALPPFDIGKLPDVRSLNRAMLLMSFMGHAYVWGEAEPPSALPASLSVPWYEVSQKLGRPPVLSYDSYASHNWYRLDPNRPIELGNIALLQNFWGGTDEEWFILIHIEIEREAAPAVCTLPIVQAGVTSGDTAKVSSALTTIGTALAEMYHTLCRMPEFCDPYCYYRRVRPYIHGWKANPAIPDGMIYAGVDAYGGKPQQFRGETGSQSAIVPALDAALGVGHVSDPLKEHLNEMRTYMPPKHRAYIELLESGPNVRPFVQEHAKSNSALKDAYNECITWLQKFRAKHVEYAAEYIDHQDQASKGNPTKIGTGGTPFLQYLKKHRDETGSHLID